MARLRPWRLREHSTQAAEKQVLEEAAQTKTHGHVATRRIFLSRTPTMFSRVLRSSPLAQPAQGLRGLISIENATGDPRAWAQAPQECGCIGGVAYAACFANLRKKKVRKLHGRQVLGEGSWQP